MTRRTPVTVFVAVSLAFLHQPGTFAQRAVTTTPIRTTDSSPAYQRFLSPASPLELVAAKSVDRIAWTSFEEGKRNAYTAAAPRSKAWE